MRREDSIKLMGSSITLLHTEVAERKGQRWHPHRQMNTLSRRLQQKKKNKEVKY